MFRRANALAMHQLGFSLSLHIFAAISLHVVFPFIFFPGIFSFRFTFFSAVLCVCWDWTLSWFAYKSFEHATIDRSREFPSRNIVYAMVEKNGSGLANNSSCLLIYWTNYSCPVVRRWCVCVCVCSCYMLNTVIWRRICAFDDRPMSNTAHAKYFTRTFIIYQLHALTQLIVSVS